MFVPLDITEYSLSIIDAEVVRCRNFPYRGHGGCRGQGKGACRGEAMDFGVRMGRIWGW